MGGMKGNKDSKPNPNARVCTRSIVGKRVIAFGGVRGGLKGFRGVKRGKLLGVPPGWNIGATTYKHQKIPGMTPASCGPDNHLTSRFEL
eukprot:4025009-Pyramimonas_sp.AAC.1